MAKKWFENYIGCAFYLDNTLTERPGEYIYLGSRELLVDNKRKPNGYWFELADDFYFTALDYKQARSVMGAMIDANTYHNYIKEV